MVIDASLPLMPPPHEVAVLVVKVDAEMVNWLFWAKIPPPLSAESLLENVQSKTRMIES